VGKYAEIQNLIQDNVPDFTNLNLVPRGTPIFPDLLMTGQMRFARRTGANFAVMNPDNQMLLTADGINQNTILAIQRVLPWVEENALLTFNGTEMLQVSDFDTTSNTVVLAEPLPMTYPSGSLVTLWATPLIMNQTAAEGVSQIQVLSRYSLLNGDAVTMLTSTSINSLKQITVLTADYLGVSANPEFTFIYNLTLQQPIPVPLDLSSQIFLRAFPGYLSNALSVPSLLTTASQMGPFLMDYVANPLDNATPAYTEYFSVRTYDAGGNAILGTSTALMTATKNQPILNRPIWAENMIFWNILRGTGGFKSPNQYRLISDADGLGRVYTRLIPAWPSGLTWTFDVAATASGILRIETDTFGFQDFPLTVNTTTTVTLSTPPGSLLNRLDFIINMDSPGAEVDIQNSNLQAAVTAQIQYGYVFRVIGTYNYQAESICVKPYFLALADLSATYDSGSTYNSGIIYYS
jgi:hypothetical protein